MDQQYDFLIGYKFVPEYSNIACKTCLTLGKEAPMSISDFVAMFPVLNTCKSFKENHADHTYDSVYDKQNGKWIPWMIDVYCDKCKAFCKTNSFDPDTDECRTCSESCLDHKHTALLSKFTGEPDIVYCTACEEFLSASEIKAALNAAEPGWSHRKSVTMFHTTRAHLDKKCWYHEEEMKNDSNGRCDRKRPRAKNSRFAAPVDVTRTAQAHSRYNLRRPAFPKKL